MAPLIQVEMLANCNPDPKTQREHHIGFPPTNFMNPWPSFQGITGMDLFKTRFGSNPEKNFVPVPEGPDGSRSDELVKVRKPDWGHDRTDKLRATWIGHASFLVETPAVKGAERGIRILFDPVFSERTSPFSFFGPKRYTPTPCTVDELPDIDIICISHNHYDHLDYHTIQKLYERRKDRIHFMVALNDKGWFTQHICPDRYITELDWWDSCQVEIPNLGSVQMTCTPSQHTSARTPFDKDHGLWCSWALSHPDSGKNLYFAGDTGYQAYSAPSPCPAFAQIGETLGPFNLALIPMGLFKPQKISGGVHCSPEQALQIHKDIGSKLSIGMHYGTVRGGLSGVYEPVTEPPRRWREAAEKEDLWCGGGVEGKGSTVDQSKEGVGLIDIGETIAV